MSSKLASQWRNSLKLLKEGKYENWPQHEWIRSGSAANKNDFVPTPTYGKPIWQGEVEPITLLVNADFGIGDTIHFWRFIEQAKQRVKSLILRCDEDLHTIFTGVEFIHKEEPLPNFDKIIHMMALPKVLGIHFSGKPYLKPNPELSPHPLTKALPAGLIGICWCGNPFNPRDHERSIPVEYFVDLFNQLNIKPVSLVKHIETPFIDARALFKTWNETAYVIQRLELIITVDTAIAHLSGAMGKPTWLLLPQNPDWRWGLHGDTTYWYDSVKIFRQQKSWSDVIDQLRNELLRLSNRAEN